MAGTSRGVINQWFSNGDNMEKIIDAYKNIYDRWDAHPGMTLIADGWEGGGQDYHDGASPYGDNSFSVWRFDTNVNRTFPFYVLMCAADSGSSSGLLEGTSNPNTPTLLCSVALGIGGDGNPWNGTTAADGTDTMPTTVWATPSGGTNVKVLPARNRGGGASSVNKNACSAMLESSSGNDVLVFHMIMDDDHFACIGGTPTLSEGKTLVVGSFEPNVGLTHNNPVIMAYDFASSGSTLTENTSGAFHPDDTETTHQALTFSLDLPGSLADQDLNPSRLHGGYDTFPAVIVSQTSGHEGYLGDFNHLRLVYGSQDSTTNPDKTLASFGSAYNAAGIVVQWDGATIPKSGRLPAGVIFGY